MFNNNQHQNKRRPSFHSNNEEERERKRAREEVHAMKKKLAFGDHYQLDPNAVGFIGVHVERDKAKIFTPATFKDIRSTLRNLRHHKEEEPFKSSVNMLSRWCLKMGKEKFYVTRKKIMSELNKNEILETNTANFGLIVERMYAVTFEISNNVPLQRFRQAGKWNHWVKKIPEDDKELLAKYHSKLRRVPNSNIRYFESKNNNLSYLPSNSGPSKNSYLQEGLPSSTSVPIASNSAPTTNKNFGLQEERIPSGNVPIASWPTRSGNESQKSGSNLWKEKVDNRKLGWNIDLTTATNFTTTEKKKKVHQEEGSNEQVHINNQKKDASKNNIAGPIASAVQQDNEKSSDLVAYSVLTLDDTTISSDFNTIKRNHKGVTGSRSFNEKLHEQLFDCNIYWKPEKGLPLSWTKDKGGSHVLQINREDAKNVAIESTVRELRRMKSDEKAEDSDDEEDDEDSRYDDDSEWEGCPYSNSKKKKESRYIDESSLRLVLSNIFDDNLVWDIGLQMLVYVGNGGARNC